MLVALWQFDKEDVLAGVLLFRLLYYIVPFALSLLILGGRELVLALRGAPPPHIQRIPSLAPTEVATGPEAGDEKAGCANASRLRGSHGYCRTLGLAPRTCYT